MVISQGTIVVNLLTLCRHPFSAWRKRKQAWMTSPCSQLSCKQMKFHIHLRWAQGSFSCNCPNSKLSVPLKSLNIFGKKRSPLSRKYGGG